MGWYDVVAWDASGEADAQARTLPSARVGEVLRSQGFVHLGVLGVRVPFVPEGHHAAEADRRLDAWGSEDRVVLALERRSYGVDELELLSMLRDGTIVRTRWASHAGGIPLGWRSFDPAGPPPEACSEPQWGTRGVNALHVDVDEPEAGVCTLRMDDRPLEDGVALHRARVAERVAAGGPAEPLDVAALAGVVRRYAAVGVGVEKREADGPPVLAILMGGLLMILSVTYWNPDPNAGAEETLERLRRVRMLAPVVGGVLGIGLSRVLARPRGPRQDRALSWLWVPGLLAVRWMSAFGGGGAAGWMALGLGVLVGVAVGWVAGPLVFPVVTGWIRRHIPHALAPVLHKVPASELRRRYGVA